MRVRKKFYNLIQSNKGGLETKLRLDQGRFNPIDYRSFPLPFLQVEVKCK